MKIFLSAPISASDAHDYKRYNKKVIEIKKELLLLSDVEYVFYAGEELKDNQDFDSPESALLEDIGELRKCDTFVMIYPKKVPTSAIFEAGVAYERGMDLLFYYKKNEELPFLIRGIRKARIVEFQRLSEIQKDLSISLNKN